MGYNNNHAGMHMIWYRRRNSYENLEYYDRLAEESSRKKKELSRKVQTMNNEEKEEVKEVVIEKVEAISNSTQTQNTNQNKKKKHKSGNQNKKNKKPDEQSKKEKVIDDEYFQNTIDWYANIYLVAFERKLDIYEDVCECERLCEADVRMADGYADFFNPVTNLDKTIVFLNMLADKMDCDVYEFVFPSADMRSRRVYRALDRLEEQYGKTSSVTYAFDYGVEEEDDEEKDYVVERFSLNQYMYLNIHTTTDDVPNCHMEYYFNKISKKDNTEKPIYTFTVMANNEYSFLRTNSQAFNYMSGGSDIISETEGRLADFFEKVKATYLVNGGTKYNYLP
jgi:hypothetical protein